MAAAGAVAAFEVVDVDADFAVEDEEEDIIPIKKCAQQVRPIFFSPLVFAGYIQHSVCFESYLTT